MAQAGHLCHNERQIPRQVVVVEVKHLKALELRKLRRESAVEDIVGQVEKSEAGNRRDLRRDCAGKLVGSDREVGEFWKATQVGRKSTGEV